LDLVTTIARLTIDDVRAAAQRLSGHIYRTPVISSAAVDEASGYRVFFKCESLQRAGSFKIRGALNKLLSLAPAERARGVVAFSSGNHAQGVALAARIVGTTAIICMPTDAPKLKVEATRGYGAEIVFAPDLTKLTALVAELQERSGAYYLHPFDDAAMITGHGTIALEVLEDLPDADVFVVGVGGGGLISGVATVVAAKRPGARIVGVEPTGAAGMRRALDAGKPVRLERIDTIADGLASPIAGTTTLEIVRRLVADVVVIDDDLIAEGMRFLAQRARLVAEPAGAAATGALLAGKIPVRPGERVVAIVSGGNVDLARMAQIFGA